MQNLHWTIPPILEGTHVTLEPLQPHHGDDLLAAAADGELWNLWYTSVPNTETIRGYMARAMADREAGTAMPFLVRDASGEPVGSTRFFRMDPVVPSLEIGYTWYSARVQRTALNTEAKRILVRDEGESLGDAMAQVIELLGITGGGSSDPSCWPCAWRSRRAGGIRRHRRPREQERLDAK